MSNRVLDYLARIENLLQSEEFDWDTGRELAVGTFDSLLDSHRLALHADFKRLLSIRDSHVEIPELSTTDGVSRHLIKREVSPPIDQIVHVHVRYGIKEIFGNCIFYICCVDVSRRWRTRITSKHIEARCCCSSE